MILQGVVMVGLKMCRRCGGDLVLRGFEMEIRCLQCGRGGYIQQEPRPLAVSAVCFVNDAEHLAERRRKREAKYREIARTVDLVGKDAARIAHGASERTVRRALEVKR